MWKGQVESVGVGGWPAFTSVILQFDGNKPFCLHVGIVRCIIQRMKLSVGLKKERETKTQGIINNQGLG